MSAVILKFRPPLPRYSHQCRDCRGIQPEPLDPKHPFCHRCSIARREAISRQQRRKRDPYGQGLPF